LIAVLLAATAVVAVSDIVRCNPNVFIDVVIVIVALQVGYVSGVVLRALVYAATRSRDSRDDYAAEPMRRFRQSTAPRPHGPMSRCADSSVADPAQHRHGARSPTARDEHERYAEMRVTTCRPNAATEISTLKRVPDFGRAAYCLLGLVVDAVTFVETTTHIGTVIRHRRRCFLSTPNMNWITISRTDPVFRASVLSSDLSVADGTPLIWVARLIGLRIERIAGSDLFETLMNGAAGQLTVFFFGGPEGIARAACERVENLDGALRCNGYEYPGFGSVEQMSTPRILQKINHSGADMLNISLGARKGLLWITRNEQHLTNPVVWHCGAVVNFAAGTITRAPALLSRLGFEWLWRIKQEPHLWRRYFADLMTLTGLVTFRVIPCAVYQIISRPTDPNLKSARLDVIRSEPLYTLRFSGPWTERNLGPARDALQRAAEEFSDLVLDLENLTYADAAFFGLIMIAYGNQIRTRCGFSVCSTSKKVRRIMWLHGCEFLINTRCDRERECSSH
jgi:N-acetylglucosaminyldiphosphoundecaprenol N-acetyl-beta-D-mannosaminyltransferase